MNSTNEFIYLTGPDGSGKTSFIKEVENELKERGFKTFHIWLRSPKIISKPLMAYCRLVGLTKYTTIDGIKYGSHEFYRSRIVSWLYPILQFIDFKIKNAIILRRIKNATNTLFLIDRHAIDTLVDVMVDTGRYDLHRTCLGKNYLKMIPPNKKVIVMQADANKIRERKKDTLFDQHLSHKIKAFEILSNELNLEVVDNNRSYEEVKREVFEIIKINERY